MKQTSLKKNAFYNMLRGLMNIIFPIISFPYASRILMPEGLGKVNFANSVIEYFVLFALLGIKAYASRECARVRDDREKLSRLAKEILIINAVSTVISYILLFFALVFIPKFAEYRILLIVCSTKILFSTIGMDWLYTANEEYRYITMRSVFFQFLSLVFLFTFVKAPDDYVFYAGMGVFSSVGSNFCNLIYSRRFINIFTKSPLNLKRHFKPVLTFFGTTLAGKLHSALDAVMLGFLLSSTSVGYYSAASKISLLVRQLIQAICQSLMPRSSYYLETGEIEKFNKMVYKAADVVFFFSVPAAFGLYFLCKPLIIIFSGDQYLPALSAMKIIVPTVIICSFNSFLNNLILIPNRKEKIFLIAQCIAAGLNIVLNAVFIPLLGVFGAALATLLVEAATVIVSLSACLDYFKTRDIYIAFLQALTGAVIMFAGIFFMFSSLANPFLQTVFSIFTGGLIYAVVMLIFKNQTALMILNIFKKKVKK